jgi:hypothetical protein
VSHTMSPKRALSILLCAVTTAGLMLALSFVASSPARSAAYRLSDLGIAKLTNIQIQTKMYYAGDGHNHWHVRNLQRFTLTRLDNGVKVGTGAKHGFCFFDNYRYGSTREPYYTAVDGSCAYGAPKALKVKMGLSVGWGDIYRWKLPGQYVDITGLASGRYRLRCVADPSCWFREKDDTNNFAWVDLQITRIGVTVLEYGPSAQHV